MIQKGRDTVKIRILYLPNIKTQKNNKVRTKNVAICAEFVYTKTISQMKQKDRKDFKMSKKQVGIIMGSDNDLKIVKGAAEILDQLGVTYDIQVSSAHRTPEYTKEYIQNAENNGIQVIIAAAGMAAHLPGVCAAYTTLPVIGLPIESGALKGLDALYAIVQMPSGIPVATMGIDAAKNAGLFAAQIIALNDPSVSEKYKAYRANMKAELLKKNEELQTLGVKEYLKKKESK